MAEKGKEKEGRVPARRDPFLDAGWLEGWSPFRELGGPRFSRLMERLMDEPWPGGARGGRFAPALDVHEDDGRYLVTVELPGVKRDDVSVEIQEGVLSIRGEKRSERDETQEKSRYVERSYGSFTRAFTLPQNADPDRVEASFQDGVLTISIAKREEEKPKSIRISS